MPPLTSPQLAALVRRCEPCGAAELRAHAIVAGTMLFGDGEPASAFSWTYAPEHLAGRVYRVACASCGAVPFEVEDCPLCGAKAGLERALGGRHGVEPPRVCPRCEHEELRVTAEARMHVVFVLGHAGRRVLDAEPHDPAFHVTSVECVSCKETVASVSQRCAACGRSSLVRRR
jgi:hypothetical protein